MSGDHDAKRLFDTYSHAWREVGLARKLSRRAVKRAHLEEVDGDEVVVRITATPEHPADGPKLASEVPDAIASRDRPGTA